MLVMPGMLAALRKTGPRTKTTSTWTRNRQEWGSWTEWSSCTKTCDGGQKRHAAYGSCAHEWLWLKTVLGSHFGVGEFTTHFRTNIGGDWDVAWGHDLDFDPWPNEWKLRGK